MAKRGRMSGGSVTGGSGDIKPQLLIVDSGTAGAVDDYVVNAVNLPVPKFGAGKSKTLIFEILKVYFYLGIRDLGDLGATHFASLSTGSIGRASGDATALASIDNDLLDPRTFASAVSTRTTTTSGAYVEKFPIVVDLTDSNGNGYLVATDKLTISAGALNNTTPASYIAKVLYRLVSVGTLEYVGIVQSQID